MPASLTNTQTAIIDFVIGAVNNRENLLLFLNGAAGTGKSTILKAISEQVGASEQLKVAKTANGAQIIGGSTLDSVLVASQAKAMKRRYDASKKNMRGTDRKTMFQNLKLVIIDEISMATAHDLNQLDLLIKNERKSDLPFGGVCVVVSGDFGQLSPIEVKDDPHVKIGKLKELGTQDQANKFRPAFLSAAWPLFKCKTLTEIVRQKNLEFVRQLQNVRYFYRLPSTKQDRTIEYFNQFAYENEERGNGRSVRRRPPLNSFLLTGTCKDLEAFNDRKELHYARQLTKDTNHSIRVAKCNFKTNEKLTELKKLEIKSEALCIRSLWKKHAKTTKNNFGPKWMNRVNVSNSHRPMLLPDQTIILHPNVTRVMWAKNDGSKRLINGSRGLYVGHVNGFPVVKFDSIVAPKILTPITHTVDIISEELPSSFPRLIHPGKNDIIGWPLRLLWGSTVHAMQGSTCRQPVFVNVDTMFAAGQLNVAITRPSKAEYLELSRPLEKSDFKFSKSLRIIDDWCENNQIDL